MFIGIAGICEDAAAEEDEVVLTASVLGDEVSADPAGTGGEGVAIAATNAREDTPPQNTADNLSDDRYPEAGMPRDGPGSASMDAQWGGGPRASDGIPSRIPRWGAGLVTPASRAIRSLLIGSETPATIDPINDERSAGNY